MTEIDASVGAFVDRVASLVPGPSIAADSVQILGDIEFASAFDVRTLALGSSVAFCAAVGAPELDADRVAATFSGRVLVDGEQLPVWADLSGYYRTRDDRFLQIHANFPHHAAGVVERLGVTPDRAAVQDAILGWDPTDLETRLIDDGMVAARLRTIDEWDRHPHARATAGLPVITVERIGDGAPRDPDRRLRVLDCSRILAGPVTGQALAGVGADVVRVGAPHLPSVEIAVVGTGAGKRNAFADLADRDGRKDFAALLAGADVWIDAYRPGTLAARGFGPENCKPGSVVVQLSGFDWVGPWAGRRGFDSIVQSTSGIVEAGRTAAGADGPTPLPVQALDDATGLLGAFAARRLVLHQAEHGGTWLARLSLLRTRNLLVSLGGPTPFTPAPFEPPAAGFTTMSAPFGEVTVAAPLAGAWSNPPQRLGTSTPVWADRADAASATGLEGATT